VLSPARAHNLARLLAAPLDWIPLTADAERHGVAALLHGHLRRLGPGQIPPSALQALALQARVCVAWNLRLRHELGRILAAFERAGIPVIPLKGPVLADELYSQPLLRPSEDLDILVQPADHPTGERILHDLGYGRLPLHAQGADYHTRFMSPAADGVVVELHRELGERHVSGLDVLDIWVSASRTSWQRHTTWSMTGPDLLLYLCMHAAKDGLASIKALLDITLLLERSRDEFHWSDLGRRVKTVHLSGPIYLSLREARTLLGAPVPDEFLEALRPRRPTWRLSEALFRWRGGVLHVPDELLVGPFMAVLMLLWEDSLRGKLRHLRRNVLPSASLRARWVSLPPSISWLVWYPAWLWQATRHVARQLTADRPRHPDGVLRVTGGRSGRTASEDECCSQEDASMTGRGCWRGPERAVDAWPSRPRPSR